MKLIFVILSMVSLVACTTIPEIPKFPTPPAELMVPPPQLKTIEEVKKSSEK